ncbi:hypothetical protein [Treponema pedis]|uniref:hypothetical protein n=2 Tax=Treponema pedis TaxID=409322 RepID=UPI003D1FC7A6
MNKKFCFIPLFCFILFFAYARGNSEYSHAEELINLKENSAALEEISGVLEAKPESAEYAVNLIRSAMKNQVRFQEKFDELLKLLHEDPDNNEKKLKLIDDIAKSEADIDPSVVNFLDKLKISSVYAIQRIKFNTIMDKGISYINEKKYNEAAETFTKGYSIYNKEFQLERTGTKTLSDVNTEMDSVNLNVKKYAEVYNKFIEEGNKLTARLKSGAAGFSEKDFSSIRLYLNEMRRITDAVFASGTVLKKIYHDEIKAGVKTEETLLPFAYRLTIGRDSATEFEGVEGAMEAGIFFNLNFFINNYWSEIKNLFEISCNAFDFKNDAEIEGNIALVDVYLKYLQKWYAEEEGNLKSRFTKNVKLDYKNRISTVLNLSEKILKTKKLYSDFLQLVKYKNKIEIDYQGSIGDLREEEDSLISDLQKAAREVNIMVTETVKLLSDTAAVKKNGADYESDTLQAKQKVFSDNIFELRVNLFEQLAILKNKSGKLAFKEAQNKYGEYHKNTVKDKDSQNDISPASTVQDLMSLKQTVDNDANLLNKFVKETELISSALISSKVFTANIDEVKKEAANLKNLAGVIADDISHVNSLLIKIKLAKNEADLRYEQAQGYLKSGNFTAARRYIELSRSKTNEALTLEEDSEYRKTTDERLEKLGMEINNAENTVVVQDVRNYLVKAKKHYYNGEFQSAEDTLILARNRWAVTHVDPNEEITNWLGIVNIAGALKTGRTIPVSAPLYPQMIQLLNNSTQLYRDSVQKINTGKRTEALKDLNAAKENIKQVLLVYPFNEVAGQLNLKIDKLADPANFYEQFRKKIISIKREYKSNSQRAYSDLLDLYSIDKKFPGIASLKDEVEIYLGIKLPPPDFVAIAEAERLTKSARNIYNSRNTIEFPVAVQLLDRAIKLDSQNIEAVRLKDEIQMAMGGVSVIVLSASNEAKYQQAVAELQKGNKIIAAALVEQLMQDANAKNSAKVRELKKRIDAQL